MNVKNIIASDAYNLLKTNDNSIIVDVRTKEEWALGVPDLEGGNKTCFISWKLSPNYEMNTAFKDQLELKIRNKDMSLFFLCRSGVRSLEATKFAQKLGFKHCFNICDGFDGGIDGIGWKNSNLPIIINLDLC